MNAQSIELFYKFCPHCGMENANPGGMPFRCEGCGFCQFFGPVAAVGALVTNDADQLLLVRRARQPGKGCWGLPGGFVDRGESMEDAMKREVFEETKLHLTDCHYLMSHPNDYNYQGVIAPVIDLFYVARATAAADVSLDADELDEHLWVRPSQQHLDRMAFHSNRLAIEHWLASSS